MTLNKTLCFSYIMIGESEGSADLVEEIGADRWCFINTIKIKIKINYYDQNNNKFDTNPNNLNEFNNPGIEQNFLLKYWGNLKAQQTQYTQQIQKVTVLLD